MFIGKTGYDKSLKAIAAVNTIFWLILLLVSVFSKQQMEEIIVFGVFLIISLGLMIYLNIYCIKIYDDRIKIRSIFGFKKYDFDKVIILFETSIRIQNLEHKELARISYFIDPDNLIYYSYTTYCKNNETKYKRNNKIKYNFYIRNFSIFGIVYSLGMFILTYVFIFNEDKLWYIIFCLILGIFSLIISVIGILNYINFRILVLSDSIVISNFIGKNQIYFLKDIYVEYKRITIRLKLNKKKKILLYYFLDNADELMRIKILKKEMFLEK